MSQFIIKGIDYTDDSLQHGLGKGSGRGRPVGSKNGQVMPGAAYMKDYKIVGQKAVGDAAVPGATNTRRQTQRTTNQRQVRSSVRNRFSTPSRTGGSRQTTTAVRQTPRASVVTNRYTTPTKTSSEQTTATVQQPQASAITNRFTVPNKADSNGRVSTPAENVSKGKRAVEALMEKGNGQSQTQQTASNDNGRDGAYQTNQPKRSRDMSTAELRALDPVGDWPWSERRVKAAGGLEAREGRQIVYDNPTLSDDYKKQIAKRYGDSNGRSYPKYLEEGDNNSAQTTNNEPAASSEQNNREATNSVLNRDASTMDRSQTAPSQNSAQNNGNAINNALQRDARLMPRSQTAPSQAPATSAQDNGNVTNNNAPAAQVQTTQSTQTVTQETPEQKSFWDNVGSWFTQAGKDIGDTAVGAWNAVSGAAGDAAKWVGDQLGPAGEWAQTAYDDVSNWVGDRGRDFGNWWNGQDIEVNDNGHWRQGHQTGAREQIGNLLGSVGQWIGDRAADVGNATGTVGQWIGDRTADAGNAVGAAGQWIGDRAADAGNALGNWWNGRDVYTQVADPNNPGVTRDVQGHQTGAREQIGNWLGNAGQTVAKAAEDTGRAASNLADDVLGRYQVVDTDENGNLVYGNQRQGGLLNQAARDANQLLGNTARDIDTFVNGPRPGSKESAPYYDLISQQWIDPTTQTLGDRIGQLVNNNVVVPATNAANAAGQLLNENIVAPATTAANGAWEFVRNAADNAGQTVTNAANNAGQALNNWWNGTDQSFLGIPTGHTPGARENIGNWVNNSGRTVSDAWNNAGQAVSNAANGVRNWAGETAQNIHDTADVAGLAGRALAAGVPTDLVGRWMQNYSNGQISPNDFEDLLDRWVNNN